KPTGDGGEAGAWWGHVPQHTWEDRTRERQQPSTPEPARKQMEPVHQDGERQVAPVGSMPRQAAGQDDEAPCPQHARRNTLAMQTPAPHAQANPQHDESPETDKPYAPIVGAQQNNRQRAPQHSQRQAAHRQRASEQLANATHRQGYQAAAKQPPQGGAERE